MSAPSGRNEAELDRLMTRLASERGVLFDKAGATLGLSDTEQQRLKVVERELDECFLERRRRRAVRDAHRFDRDTPIARGPAVRRREP
jgi:Protein of unknown function (DUF2630)